MAMKPTSKIDTSLRPPAKPTLSTRVTTASATSVAAVADAQNAMSKVLNQVLKARNDLVGVAAATKSPHTTRLISDLQALLQHYRSTFFDLKVRDFWPLLYSKWIDGWVQPPLVQGTQPILGFELTNNDPAPTSGAVHADLTDYSDAKLVFGLGGGANSRPSNLAPGATFEGDLLFYGTPPGIYNLDVRYEVMDPNAGTWTFNPVTGPTRVGGTYVAVQTDHPYVAPRSTNDMHDVIRGLSNITTVGSLGSGYFLATGTSKEGIERSLKVTNTAVTNGVALTELLYWEKRPDGTPGMQFRVRSQVVTYMEDLDRTLTYPSATLFIDSNPAPSQSGVFDRSRSLQIRATPGRPDHDNEVRVDGGYWFRASDATRSWDVQQTILGYLTPTTYTPDAGTENFDFTLPALFADELDHLSFFACVLKETDLLLAQTPPTPLQVSLGSYPGGGGPLPVGEDEGLGVENQGLGVAGLQWDFVNWTILQTPVVKKAGVSMLIGAVVIFISTPAVISWTTLAAANAAIDVGLPAVALRTLGFFANARWIPGLVSGVLRVAGIGVNVIATAKPGDFDAPPPKQPPQKPALPSAGAGGVPGMPPEMTPPPTFPDLGTSIDVPGEGMGVPPDE